MMRMPMTTSTPTIWWWWCHHDRVILTIRSHFDTFFCVLFLCVFACVCVVRADHLTHHSISEKQQTTKCWKICDYAGVCNLRTTMQIVQRLFILMMYTWNIGTETESLKRAIRIWILCIYSWEHYKFEYCGIISDVFRGTCVGYATQ